MFLNWFTVVIAAVYSAAVFLTVVGVRRAAARPRLGADLALTTVVIVAARNEAATISTCVRAVLGQTMDNFRLVVVDDRSIDRTSEVAQTAANGDPRFTLLRVAPGDDNPQRPFGKKRALLTAIEASTEDLLVFTDADCSPPPNWLRTIRDAFDPQTDFVAGYSPYVARASLMQGTVAAEAAANAVMAAGLIGLGLPVMCTARNLAYRRRAFDEAGGFGPTIERASGDDTLMLQRIGALDASRVRYVFDASSHVPTAPPKRWRNWWRQKTRHLSTVGDYSAATLVATAAVRSMDVLVVFGVPLAAVGMVSTAPLFAFLAKIVADFCGLWIGLGKLQSRGVLRWFVPLSVLNPFVLVFGALAGRRAIKKWR